MADEADIVRRREIRRRKILEQSEARLNRITSTKRNQYEGKKHGSLVQHTLKDVQENNESSSFLSQEPSKDLKSSNSMARAYRNLNNFEFDSSNSSANRTYEGGNPCIPSSNGAVQRLNVTDNYIFPKKVSDAETRSFVRSRCDARRNSTCTQMMMETFQFSSFSLADFRLWIVAVLSIALEAYFLVTKRIPLFQTLLFPYILMEVAFFSWTKFESQVNSRQVIPSFLPGVLVLCGVPQHLISAFNSILYNLQCATQDLAVYMFSFVILHFIFETYM